MCSAVVFIMEQQYFLTITIFSLLFAAFAVEGFVDLEQVLVGDVGVDLGGSYV